MLKRWFSRAPDATRATNAASGSAPAGLPKDLARRVRRIEISTNRLVDQGFAGRYHSVFKGRGMEFAEVRPYQPGDEVRSIDWNVTARMDQPFIKRLVEERDLTVFLAIDVSGSLGFGSHSILKRELAAEIAALLAFAAQRNRDRVGAALISDRVRHFLAPSRRRSHALRLVRDVLAARPEEGGERTDLDAALGSVVSTLKQRSVLFVISDFVETTYERAVRRAAARHDVVLIEIQDPHESLLPETGPVLLRDAETGRLAVVNPAGDRRAALAHGERRASERDALRRTAARLGVDLLSLSTDRAYLPSLVAFFAARQRRQVGITGARRLAGAGPR
jgi:uncharacterized protein (DUF58 family)